MSIVASARPGRGLFRSTSMCYFGIFDDCQTESITQHQGELATQINGKITSVSQSYLTEDLGNDVLKEEFINESKIAAQVILKNIAIAEEIPVKEKDGRYTVHITLKVRETDVLDAIRKHVMANERLQKVFKKEKFDELWNE